MAKVKKKLSAQQKLAKKKAKAERQRKYEWIFMSGKQVKIERRSTVEEMDVDEYIQRNADPIWLSQNGLYEFIETEEDESQLEIGKDDLPF